MVNYVGYLELSEFIIHSGIGCVFKKAFAFSAFSTKKESLE